MQLKPIHIYDSAWSSTFPHLVAPQHDEWFPGLLLRCDEVNRRESGTTSAYLLRSITSYPLRGKPSWIVVPRMVLELLAQFLAIPMSTLVSTTYYTELARLYNTASPHPTYLERSFRFHLCPDCIAEKRILNRIFALPDITCCPFHQLQLVNSCKCSTILHIFHKQALPFTCHNCSLNWANLPRLTADPVCLSIEYKLLLHYEFFFTKGTPTLLTQALQLVRDTVKRKKTPWVRCPDGSSKYVECYDNKRISLGSLVELLVGLNLTPCDVEGYNGVLPWWSMNTQNERTNYSDINNKFAIGEDTSTRAT